MEKVIRLLQEESMPAQVGQLSKSSRESFGSSDVFSKRSLLYLETQPSIFDGMKTRKSGGFPWLYVMLVYRSVRLRVGSLIRFRVSSTGRFWGEFKGKVRGGCGKALEGLLSAG